MPRKGNSNQTSFLVPVNHIPRLNNPTARHGMPLSMPSELPPKIMSVGWNITVYTVISSYQRLSLIGFRSTLQQASPELTCIGRTHRQRIAIIYRRNCPRCRMLVPLGGLRAAHASRASATSNDVDRIPSIDDRHAALRGEYPSINPLSFPNPA